MKASDTPKFRKPLHYGWIIVFTGVAILFACLGLGRFAIGMLLPSMGQSLNLSYSQMGFIGTGNFVGYMVSVLFSGMVANHLGARNTIFLGLLLVGSHGTDQSNHDLFPGAGALYWKQRFKIQPKSPFKNQQPKFMNATVRHWQ